MVDVVIFDPATHRAQWETFILASYRNSNYVLLSPDFVRWQFISNPANDSQEHTLWLILHKDKVVAQLGFVPIVGITPHGTHFSGAYPINLMVLPNYRAMGLGAILLSKLLKQVPCVVNPGTSEAGAVLCEGLGMRDLGCLKRHILVTNSTAARALAVHGRLPAAAESMARPSTSLTTKAIIAARRLPPEAPESFSPPLPVYRAERSRDFFRWRYETHPAFAYEFLLSPNLASVLVFHEERERSTGTLILRIVDLLARKEDQQALLAKAAEIAKERGAAIVDFFCSLDCYDEALERTGFFDEAKHRDGCIAALFQPLDFRDASIRVVVSGPPGSVSTAPWYITKSDSDQDRPNDKNAIRSAPAEPEKRSAR